MDFSRELHYSEGDSHQKGKCQPGMQCFPLGRCLGAGPNLAAAYMTKVQLTNGLYARVDDAFLRDSILSPTMHTTAGYAPIMPTYQGLISERALIDLVEYVKQLNSNYRIQQTLNTSPVQSPVPTSTSAPAQHTAATVPGMVKPQ
jgi:cytochrome c oxidase subunit 2